MENFKKYITVGITIMIGLFLSEMVIAKPINMIIYSTNLSNSTYELIFKFAEESITHKQLLQTGLHPYSAQIDDAVLKSQLQAGIVRKRTEFKCNIDREKGLPLDNLYVYISNENTCRIVYKLFQG